MVEIKRATTCLRFRKRSGEGSPRITTVLPAMEYGILPGRAIYLGNITYNQDGDEIGIDSAVAERVISGLNYLNRQGKKPIRIIMNTDGGSVTDGFGIYDAIRASDSPVDVEVFGSASSMGALILQAAQRRFIHPNTLLLVHEGTFEAGPASLREHEAWAEWSRRDRARMYKILGDRTNKDRTYWESICATKHEAIFDAKSALKVGLADAIIPPAKWALNVDAMARGNNRRRPTRR
jgi:ATP-dependent Clp protease, protease subunit